jgi:5-keto 4-deoxyuronate isomerase
MMMGKGADLRKALVAVSRASISPFWQALKDCGCVNDG